MKNTNYTFNETFGLCSMICDYLEDIGCDEDTAREVGMNIGFKALDYLGIEPQLPNVNDNPAEFSLFEICSAVMSIADDESEVF